MGTKKGNPVSVEEIRKFGKDLKRGKVGKTK
jgi:hypothetical protein